MTATKLIAFRVLVAAVAVGVFPFSAGSALASIVLLLFVEFIDMVDGLLAEYKGHRKPFGGFLDISADQLIETLFWFLFLEYDLVPIWIPGFILIRNTFINLLRISAIARGRTMFGPDGMLRSRMGRLLVATRFSRGIMVVVKLVGFVAAMLSYIGRTYGGDAVPLVPFGASAMHTLAIGAMVGLAIIHLVRGTIIVWESRADLDAFMWSARSAAASRT